MKKAILSITLSLIALSIFAAPKHKAPTAIKCPVTGDAVNIAKATKAHMYADYKGRRYFFCCPGCPEQFQKNPAKYSKAPSIATPKHA